MVIRVFLLDGELWYFVSNSKYLNFVIVLFVHTGLSFLIILCPSGLWVTCLFLRMESTFILHAILYVRCTFDVEHSIYCPTLYAFLIFRVHYVHSPSVHCTMLTFVWIPSIILLLCVLGVLIMYLIGISSYYHFTWKYLEYINYRHSSRFVLEYTSRGHFVFLVY